MIWISHDLLLCTPKSGVHHSNYPLLHRTSFTNITRNYLVVPKTKTNENTLHDHLRAQFLVGVF